MGLSWKQVVMFGLATAGAAVCVFFMAQCSETTNAKNADSRAACFAKALDVTDCLGGTTRGAP